MLGRTFRTLKKNPLLLVFVGAMYLLPVILSMVSTTLALPDWNDPTAFADGMQDNFWITYFTVLAIVTVIGLLMATLVMPPIWNYLYEVCAGKNTTGWYKRGLKRGWWRFVVLGLIYFGVALVFMLIMTIFTMILGRAAWLIFISMIVMIVFGLAVSVYATIAPAAIMAEDEFGNGLRNIFSLGSRYFFKMFGTIVLVAIPSIIISIIQTGSQMRTLMNDTYTGLDMSSYWVTTIIAAVYGVFAYTYLYTYSMNSYLNEKGVFNAPLVDEEIVTEQSFEIASDSDIEE